VTATDAKSTRPYLSIVAAARNDNHGGDLLRRMQIFINGVVEQCERFRIPAELILVEWNPPADKPRLADVLTWPAAPGWCAIRIIEVDAATHARYRGGERLPLYQMIAKNVGIRRAQGEFVLATNIDVLFSNELMQTIGERALNPQRMYRVDRWDAAADVPLDATIDEQLAWCRDNVIRVCGRHGTLELATGRHHHASRAGAAVWLFHKLQDLHLYPVVSPLRLHTNACGDFTLLARDAWFHVRGYAEFDMYSMHLDSLLVHTAAHAGYRQQIWRDPRRVYHIEHGGGWTPEADKKLGARLDAAGVPRLDYGQLWDWTLEMRLRGARFFNDEDSWGLPDSALPEQVLRPFSTHISEHR
jgi:hypothetical protein